MAKSIKKNFVLNIILTISSMIFPLITMPYVTGILLDVGMGKVSFALSFISYFQLFAGLGIPTYGIRAVAQCRDDKSELSKTSHELLFINLITTAISYVVLAVLIFFIPKLREEKLLYVIISATIFLSSIGMEWLYKGLENYSYITIRSIIFKFLALVMTFLLIKTESDYILYGLLSVFAASASNILNLFYARKYISFKWQKNYQIKKHLKPVLVFFALSCATTIYTHLDTTMLGFIVGDAAVGQYDVAIKLKNFLTILVTSLGAVLLPRVSYFIEKGEFEEFWKINKKGINFVFVLAVPLIIYFTLFAKESVFFISNELFSNAILPFQIILPVILFIGLTNVMGIQILVPLGKEKIVLYSCIAGAVVNLILNGIFIPLYAEVGAAIGTLVAEFVVLIYQYVTLRKDVKDAFLSVQYYKILIATLIAFISCFWVKSLSLGIFLTLLISACIFFVVYGIILLILKEKFIFELFKQFMDKLKKNKL